MPSGPSTRGRSISSSPCSPRTLWSPSRVTPRTVHDRARNEFFVALATTTVGSPEDVIAGGFEELDVVDGEAADVRPPIEKDDGSEVAATLDPAWRFYEWFRRLF